jgi:hypothetical protein
MRAASMGFWRSLRRWWSWDGSPDTDPFRDPESTTESDGDGVVSGHAHAPAEVERLEPEDENDA